MLQFSEFKPCKILMIETSSEQNSKSAMLFEALIQRDNEKIFALVGTNVRDALLENSEPLDYVYGILPRYLFAQAEIIAVTPIIEQPIGEITKIDYVYHYPKEIVLLSVVYRGQQGGNEVVGLWVDVQENDPI